MSKGPPPKQPGKMPAAPPSAPVRLELRPERKGQQLTAKDRFPHRMTVGAHQRMAELDFDPLEWSVKIARGEALTKDHPFLQFLKEWYFKRSNDLDKGNAIDWHGELAEIIEEAKTQLSDSWVPLNLRSDHVKELMQYLYPKLKSVEHSGTIQNHIRIKPLQASEVDIFLKKFNAKY